MTPIGAVDAIAGRHRYHLLETLPWLALGQNVQFALKDIIYEVFDQAATSGGKP